jgi:3-deoxy-D-manno-octulosonate 8-phosphate phosphatase KdsC-like HAD superfamily phosphatase
MNQPSRRCGILSGRASPQVKNRNSNSPVQTQDSLCPDARSSNKEIADSTLTVRTTAYHGSDAHTSDMKNCVLKINCPDVHPPLSGRAKPYMEIT